MRRRDRSELVAVFEVKGLAFVLWTSANLLPRAMWRHQQYRRKFVDYPHQRRTLIPFAMWSRQVGSQAWS